MGDYNAAIAAQPKSAAAFYGRAYGERARAYRGKGELDKALADFDEAVRLDPKPASLYIDRGTIHQSKGNLDQAIADYGLSRTGRPGGVRQRRASNRRMSRRTRDSLRRGRTKP